MRLVFALIFGLLVVSSLQAAESVHIKIVNLKGAQVGEADLSPTSPSKTISNLPAGEVKFVVTDAHNHTMTLAGDLNGDGVSDCVVSPRDVASGQATGKRMHKPILIYKEWNATAASPTVCASESEAKMKWDLATNKGGRSKSDVYVWKITCADGSCTVEVLSWSFGASNPR